MYKHAQVKTVCDGFIFLLPTCSFYKAFLTLSRVLNVVNFSDRSHAFRKVSYFSCYFGKIRHIHFKLSK